MNLFGLTPGAVLRLLREAGDPGRPGGALLVDGPLAPQLARLLADGGEPALVRAGGDPAAAAAVICVLGGAPTTEQLALLRRATRAGVPTVAVQTAPAAAEVHVPYVLAEDVVPVPAGAGFPMDEIAAAVTRGLGRDAAPLAARLPVLRAASRRSLTVHAASTAAGLAAAPWVGGSNLPVLVPLQARLLRDLDVVDGGQIPDSQQAAAATVGQQLGTALAVGVAARSLVRRLPFRSRVVDSLVAGGATFALGRVAARLR